MRKSISVGGTPERSFQLSLTFTFFAIYLNLSTNLQISTGFSKLIYINPSKSITTQQQPKRQNMVKLKFCHHVTHTPLHFIIYELCKIEKWLYMMVKHG
jgi:hypothetical protein